jgi:hypothetical protein
MKRFIPVYFFISLFAFQTNAQSLLALSTGISADLNNERPFYSIPVTLRWEPLNTQPFS